MGGGAGGAASIIKGLAEGIDACGHRAPLPRGLVCVFVFGGGGGGVFSLSPPRAFAGKRGDLSDPNTKEVGSLEREVRVGVGAGARFWK